MDALEKLYSDTALEYKKFFDKVHKAFTAHCEEIKAKTNAKLEAVAPDDKEGRQKILMDQKVELDTALAELKEVLDAKGKEAREKLEQIAAKQEQSTFNLEEELANV